MSPASGAVAGGRKVTIRSMSCRGVKAFVPFQKPPLYAAVSLGGRREKTPPDADGGENPDWEGAVFAFDLDAGDGQQLVEFEVKAQVPLLGTKVVGTASVPVADLDAAGGGGHVSYQVCAPDGKPNGTLSFAYAISTSGGGANGGPPPEQGPTFFPAPPNCSASPEQGPTFFSAPPAVTAYPAQSTGSFAPHGHGGGYPTPPSASAPVSGSLYPPLHDLLPSSTYPPPPQSTLPHPTTTATNPHFPGPNSSCYPPPAATNSASVYPPPPPPPPDSPCTAGPPPHYVSSYPPPPPSSYPPPPPSGYPPTITYPPPPESGSAYPPVLPSHSSSRSVDRELPYYSAPPGGAYYPPPPELDNGAARTPYYYPPPGSRYP